MVLLLALFGLAATALKIKPLSKGFCIWLVVFVLLSHPAYTGLILMRIGHEVSPWRFVPVMPFTVWLLYTIARHLRPGRRDIIDPIYGVTVSTLHDCGEGDHCARTKMVTCK